MRPPFLRKGEAVNPLLIGSYANRSTVIGGPYVKINDNIAQDSGETTTYPDDVSSSFVPSRTYYYVITAVDTGDNESEYSDET